MSVYAVGDVQGCHDALMRLLAKIRFNPAEDQLWLCGDLINRGPASLEVLRFAWQHRESVRIVLGNHDLHLLALALDVKAAQARQRDTLDDILTAPDREPLIEWLRRQPLMHFDESTGYSMIHAGLAPGWDRDAALAAADEVSATLNSDGAAELLAWCYRNPSDGALSCDDALARQAATLAWLTRARFCTPDGALDHQAKGPPGSQPQGLVPWFDVPGARWRGGAVVFGHWAALGRFERGGDTRLIGLDSGCVWGNCLTAVRLDCAAPRFAEVSCADGEARILGR